MTRRPLALVTGSAGFIGRHVSAQLVAAGWTVHGIDLARPARVTLAETHIVGDAVQYWRGTSSASHLLAWRAGEGGYYPPTRYDLVVHAAAVVGGRSMIDGDPLTLAAVDLELDAGLWRWALRHRPRRVLYLSSSAVYPTVMQGELGRPLAEELVELDKARPYLGRPDQTYGLVKLVGELLALEARAAGVPVTVIRPFSGYGVDQAVDYPFPAFIARALAREDPFVVWGPGTQVRDFVHVDDVVRMALELVDADVDDAVNIGTGRPCTFLELAELVTSAAGYRPAIVPQLDKPVGVHHRVADTTRARYTYGLEARVTLEAGIADALTRGGHR